MRIAFLGAIALKLLLRSAMLLVASAAVAQGMADAPAALFVHGGGWAAGNPDASRLLEPRFAEWGIRRESAEYRKVPQVDLLTSVADVRAAIDRVRGAGNRPVIVIGHSAGAHLAAAAALGADRGQRACLVLLDGIGYDMPRLLQERPGLQSRLHLTPEGAAAVSPIAMLDPKDSLVQMFIAAGRDARNTEGQGRVLAEAAQRQGVRAEFRYYPEMNHKDFLEAFRQPSSQLVADVRSFVQACAK